VNSRKGANPFLLESIIHFSLLLKSFMPNLRLKLALNKCSQAQWLMHIIPATQKMEIKEIIVRGKTHREKVSRNTPSQPKALFGSALLSSQLGRKPK
jgi:hypothetical protein